MAESAIEVSVVIPLLNEEESLPELHQWLSKVLTENFKHFEVIYVDDGSTDHSWQVLQDFTQKDSHVKAIRFNRNLGKSAALDSGFAHASGKVVITMDADLQDSPDEIPALYDMIVKDGFHLVSGWKKKRRDPLGKTIPSRFFNYITRLVSGIKLHDFNCGLKAYDSRVTRSIRLYGEMHRYIPLLAKWSGFSKIGEKVVVHRPRIYGVSKFGLERYIKGFLDLLSVTFVTRFRRKPMHFFGTLGTLSFFGGFGSATYIIADKLIKQAKHLPIRDVTNQPLFFLSLVALIVGVQLFLAGFLAELVLLNNTEKQDHLVAEKINC